MPAPEIIHQLVAKFEENREAYRSGKYNEAQLRQEFIDKFFEALGWDIYNKNGYSPEYRDVVIEDSLEIEGGSKAPDYAFKIGKERKFYVEAKKPRVDIQYDIHPAYQLKRYAWNAHLPLSILTDFEEFAVYNCKNKPNPSDSAATARDKFYRYSDYIDKWDEIAAIFSREAVWGGSFDRFAETSKGKKGTSEVDDAILGDIETWRKLLALNIALRNHPTGVPSDPPTGVPSDPQVSDESQLNYAVQMIIDRIIFLRICEDRGIEPEDQLKSIAQGKEVYPRMVELFRRADMKYNSGLFHFNKEKGNHSSPDTFTPALKIDDKVLKEIITSIYYPCPYIFKEIPVEILGQVYEQFLGKVIRLTPGHQAKIEEKPEVRKAGGVYYTPKYIVDYIVQNTVGKLLEGKTPAEAASLKILDPACGSGSFLLGAYQHLLDWHLQWYTQNEPEKWTRGKNPALMPASGAGWKLTTAKRKEILVNNIHGVDIDAQAVEVTKLSLLLKVLEEESGQLSLGLERVLPDLGNNIQCGNSLIGEDYFAGQLAVDPKERRRVNPFEWQRAFPQVFAGKSRDLHLVTFVTHNSRISERMVEYGVQRGDPVVLDTSERYVVAQKIAECIAKHQIPAVAWNVLPDHVHMVLAAESEQELGEFVRKIKGFSSFAFQRDEQIPEGSHIWAQKYHHEMIVDQRMLENVYSYVMENHIKHAEQWGQELIDGWEGSPGASPRSDVLPSDIYNKGPINKGLKPLAPSGVEPLVVESCMSVEDACQPLTGGFDAVISNPPYIRIQAMKEWAPTEVEFYKRKYKAASKGNYDIYVVFVEKGLSLLNSTGRLGFILPHKFFNAQYGQPLRELISKGHHLAKVVHFCDQQVFEGATTYTCLMFLEKTSRNSFDFEKVTNLDTWRIGINGDERVIESEKATLLEWNFGVGRGVDLFERLENLRPRLGDVATRLYQGPITSADNVYLFKQYREKDDNYLEVYSEVLNEWVLLETKILKSVVRSGNIKRYLAEPKALVLFPYDVMNNEARLLPVEEFHRKFPLAWSYLSHNKKFLEGREKGKFKDKQWYRFGRTQNLGLWEQPKLMIPYMVTELSAYLDSRDNFYFINVTTGGYGVTVNNSKYSLTYLCGLLNSKLLDYYFKKVSTNFHGGYFAANKQYIEKLPICEIDFNNPVEITLHDQVVQLVERMLELHKRTAVTPLEQEQLAREIVATDRAIDALVYELYGLTDEEIRIVEGD